MGGNIDNHQHGEPTGEGMFGNRKPPAPLPIRLSRPWWHETHDAKHSQTPPQWVYGGFSKTAPLHHVFNCAAPPDPPIIGVKLVPYDWTCFDEGTKAGAGGCSAPLCPTNAEWMSVKPENRRSYCDEHMRKKNPLPEEPCTVGNIHPCLQRQGGRACNLCEEYEHAN